MFESWILVCLSAMPNMCTEVRDTLGPYPTEEECSLRNDEMAQYAFSNQLFEVTIRSRCKVIDDEFTTPDSEKEGTDSPTGTVLGTST